MAGKMPIGVDDFKKLIDGGYNFVDKTDFIRQLIDIPSAVTLITRPRRFGKTLTMSMLDWFFSLEKEKESRHLFDGLQIEKAGPLYMEQRGKSPVLFLSLKDIKNPSWQDWPRMLKFFQLFLSQLYIRYRYLAGSSRIDQNQRQLFDHIVNQTASEDEMSLALFNLTAMLGQYYEKSVILLLDEYDVPIQQAWESGYYTGCVGFMRQFLGAALKSNENLDFALLTGVLRISKESIFSGLNNLRVCTVTSKQYANVFGFTAAEVQKMAEDLQRESYLPLVKEWYDGYRFAGQEIYNPWSVVNFFQNDEVDDYWVNTSGNGILRFLLHRADARQTAALQNLLEGGVLPVTLNEQVVYENIKTDPSALYTLLLTTGYLTAVKSSPVLRNRYELRIPNKEIRDVYSTEILNNLVPSLNENSFDDLFDYLFQGDSENFAYQLQKILRDFVSSYDAAHKESFYHGFMLGMTALFLGNDYQIESNRESGYGRFDLAIFPKDAAKTGVILEFKAASSERELEQKADEALQQIASQEYTAEFTKRGIRKVWAYGIAFWKKKVCVRKIGNDRK